MIRLSILEPVRNLKLFYNTNDNALKKLIHISNIYKNQYFADDFQTYFYLHFQNNDILNLKHDLVIKHIFIITLVYIIRIKS